MAAQGVNLPDMPVTITVKRVDNLAITDESTEGLDLAVYAGLMKLSGALRIPQNTDIVFVGKLLPNGDIVEYFNDLSSRINSVDSKFHIADAVTLKNITELPEYLRTRASKCFASYVEEREDLADKISRSFIKLISYLETVTFGPDEKFAVPVQTDPEGSCIGIYPVLLKSIEYKDNDVVLTGDYTDVLGNENTDHAFSLMDVEWPVDALGNLYEFLVQKI